MWTTNIFTIMSPFYCLYELCRSYVRNIVLVRNRNDDNANNNLCVYKATTYVARTTSCVNLILKQRRSKYNFFFFLLFANFAEGKAVRNSTWKTFSVTGEDGHSYVHMFRIWPNLIKNSQATWPGARHNVTNADDPKNLSNRLVIISSGNLIWRIHYLRSGGFFFFLSFSTVKQTHGELTIKDCYTNLWSVESGIGRRY